MNARYTRILLASALLLLSACAHIETASTCKESACRSFVVSQPLGLAAAAPAYSTGVIYNLPTQQLEFGITRSEQTKEKLDKDLADKEAKVVDITKAIKEKEEANKLLDEQYTTAPAGSVEAKSKLGLELEIGKIELLVLKARLLAAEKKREDAATASEEFDASDPAHKFKDTIELKVLDPVPDHGRRYVARLRQGNFSSETFEVKTTANGLLSGGSGKSEGKLDDIVVALASAVGTFRQPKANYELLSENFLEAPASLDDKCDARDKATVKVRFSPADLRSDRAVELVQEALEDAHFCYELRAMTTLAEGVEVVSGAGHGLLLNDNEYLDGLVYPVTTTLQFDLYRQGESSPFKTFYPQVIDGRTLGVLSLKNGLWADNNYEYEFGNGLLTRYKSVTPNQLVSALGMIPQAGKALLSVPAELIQLKIDYSTKEKSYYEALLAATKARFALEAALAVSEPTASE